MEITWFGLSCFRLSERGGISIVCDPYDHQQVGFSPLKLKAEVVTISHDAPGHSHLAAVKGDPYVIQGPGEFEIGGVFVTGVRTNGKKRNPDEPYNTLYLFDFDGLSIVHLGDISRVPTQAEVEALGQVDVVLVPVGGGGSLTPDKAVEVINILEPSIVIPMHYALPESTLKLLPLSRFLKEMGVEHVEPQPTVKIERSRLPEETQVIVLEARKS